MKYQILLTPQQHQEMMKQAVDNFFYNRIEEDINNIA